MPGKRKFYDQTALTEALVALTRKENPLTLTQAKEKYGVPRATLHDRLRGRYPPTKLKGGSGRHITDIEEASVVRWIKQRLEKGETVGKSEVLQAVKSLLDSNGRKVKIFTNNKPGYAWWEGFLSRNPDLDVRRRTRRKRKSSLVFKFDSSVGKLQAINTNTCDEGVDSRNDNVSSSIDSSINSSAVSSSKDLSETKCERVKSRYGVAANRRRRIPNSKYNDDYEWFPISHEEEASPDVEDADVNVNDCQLNVSDCELGASVTCVSTAPDENGQSTTSQVNPLNESFQCWSSEIASAIAKAVKDITENSSKSTIDKSDPDDLFFSSICSEVKKFPKPVKCRLKLRMLELIAVAAEQCS